MKILINGSAIDAPADLKITLVWRNQYFDFENALAGRTSSFTLPPTAKNLSVLGFPTIPTQGGGVMRSTMSAILQEGVTQISGILYAKQASSKEGLQCVITYGEANDLIRIKSAGNIGEYLKLSDKVEITTTPTPVTPANFNYPEYDNSISENLTSLRMPAVKLDYLLQECANHFNVSCDIVTNSAIVCNTLNKGGEIGTGRYLPNVYFIPPDIDTYIKPCNVEAEDVVEKRVLRGIIFLRPCIVKFVGDNPWEKATGLNAGKKSQGIKIMKQPAIQDDSTGTTILSPIVTLDEWIQSGDTYSDDQYIDVEWEVEAGDAAIFYQENLNYTVAGAPYYSLYANTKIDVNIIIKDAGGKLGSEYFLQPNLPQCNFLDLLRMSAVINGGTLIYEAGHFFTGTYDFDTANATNLHPINADVLYKCEVSDYAQKNTVTFDSNDDVTTESKAQTEIAYNINNTLLSESKELFKFKFSQGNISPLTTNNVAQIKCVKRESDNSLSLAGMSKPVIAKVFRPQNSYEVLQVFTPPMNSILSDICTFATSAEMRILQDISEFMRIDNNTAYYYAGCYWCVLEAQWSGGVTKLKLQRYK